ncbi:MAG: hypothetical protein KAT71_00405 [Gammaproteobacteria bacterium]|nr:hypothetical protein [Gammaproteobacteria bacterium]
MLLLESIIDLHVSRPSYYNKEGFEVTLAGASIGRLVETICMFLAIYDAKLPIAIANPEGIRKRLLAQDDIGIIPCHCFLHRANQMFAEEDAVFDILYLDDLGRYKPRIKPFITWEPLPIFKPKGVLKYSVVSYGHIAFLLGFGYFLGNLLNRFVIHYFKPIQIIFFAFIAALLTSLLMIGLGMVVVINLYIILIPTFWLFFLCGLIFPKEL